MDQRVSPLATTCVSPVAACCRRLEAVSAGAAFAFVVSVGAGLAFVVSWALSRAPRNGTANRTATAATAVRVVRLEREIVILRIQRLRERVERLRFPLSSPLGGRLGGSP